LSEEKPGKDRWRDPIVMVPIITAIIAAIPTYVLLIRPAIESQQPLPEPVPTTPGERASPPTVTPQPRSEVNITLDTDKSTYGIGDLVRVSGTLNEPMQGKTLRLDVYDPEGNAFQPFNESFSLGPPDDWTPAYPILSDIQVQPNDKGIFSYRFPVDEPSLSTDNLKGIYKIEATYGDMTGNTTFTVR
jgi:hypothetical protein